MVIVGRVIWQTASFATFHHFDSPDFLIVKTWMFLSLLDRYGDGNCTTRYSHISIYNALHDVLVRRWNYAGNVTMVEQMHVPLVTVNIRGKGML